MPPHHMLQGFKEECEGQKRFANGCKGPSVEKLCQRGVMRSSSEVRSLHLECLEYGFLAGGRLKPL